MPVNEAQGAVRAWHELCARVDGLGSEVLGEGYESALPLEMVSHVLDQTVNWLGWSVFHADPTRPAWHRQQDMVGRYGGPNADNSYRHVRLDPARSYRIAGHMHGCDDWLLTLRTAFMHQNGATVADFTASDLGFRRGERFELLLGGPDGIPIPDDVVLGTVREYYIDWRAEEPATFTIECLDAPDLSTPVTDEILAERIRDAHASIDHSVVYWNRYLENGRASGPTNRFLPSHRGAKGLNLAQYVHLYWELDADETLVVDTDVPAARYWSFQLYPMGTFEHLDLHDRITSLNLTQVETAEGRVRVAVGGTDPGWPNWLDTGGRRRGLLIYRWFWPTGEGDEPPSPSARIVPASTLEGPVTPAQRRETMQMRRRHLAWRFRE
ncbi:hypothetical protein [Yinghuangia sp. YIM S09857]|uniref:hypothetical protein n=1 Tax=Yinghuangia sp. YIM S09857 TaxID=3436929 RepID=UPI003F52EFB6